MLLKDLKKAALCVAAGFAVTMFGGCDSQKSTGAPAGAGAQRAPQVSAEYRRPEDGHQRPNTKLCGPEASSSCLTRSAEFP